MTRKHRDTNQAFIVSVKRHYKCRLCGERHVCCLTFHHLRPETKIHNIARRLANFSLRLIRAEINKCVVLCLCCHKKVEHGILEVDESHLCRIDESHRIVE